MQKRQTDLAASREFNRISTDVSQLQPFCDAIGHKLKERDNVQPVMPTGSLRVKSTAVLSTDIA